jgi:hypothetical protein
MAGPGIGVWVKVKTKSGVTPRVIPNKDGGGQYSQGQVITQSEFNELRQKRAERLQQKGGDYFESLKKLDVKAENYFKAKELANKARQELESKYKTMPRDEYMAKRDELSYLFDRQSKAFGASGAGYNPPRLDPEEEKRYAERVKKETEFQRMQLQYERGGFDTKQPKRKRKGT